MQLITPLRTYIPDCDVIRRTQEITPEFLQTCHDNRVASNHAPAGEFEQVAAIPVIVVEQWKREGFDIYDQSAHAIMNRLRATDLHAFITTDKRV